MLENDPGANQEDVVKAPEAKARGTGVQSLERAFKLLEAIAATRDGVGLAELAKDCSLHSSTAFHLVKTLVGLGYVKQSSQTRKYHLGPMVYGLAANSLDEIELVGIASPILDALARGTGESTHLGIRTGADVIVAARFDAPSNVQMSIRTRGLRPAHATAVGKILMAERSESEIERFLATHVFEALTPNTITDADRFRKELADVRRTGMAFDDGEFNQEMRCVAVPVREFSGEIIAAVGLSGPIWRLNFQALNDKASVVKEAAAELSRQLGYNGEQAPAGAAKA